MRTAPYFFFFVHSFKLRNADNFVHFTNLSFTGFCLKDLSKANYLEMKFPNVFIYFVAITKIARHKQRRKAGP